MTSGEKIKKIRLQKGFTQKELGELSGLAAGTIQQYELGKRNPKIETIHKIAKALDVSVTDLVETTVLELSNDIINLFTGKNSLKLDLKQTHMNELFDSLNEKGKDKAIEHVELLTKIPEYKKE